MPLQNRVTPDGTIIATDARGSLMGNRGLLHDETQSIRRSYQIKRWIICVLSFKGRRRQLMQPGQYTELFFLDEATALAAGHRPCAECQRPRFKEFVTAWLAGQRKLKPDAIIPDRPRVAYIDTILHQERLDDRKGKKTVVVELGSLPAGSFITLPTTPTPYLVQADCIKPWTPFGYGAPLSKQSDLKVNLLTPPSTVAAIRAGFRPAVQEAAL